MPFPQPHRPQTEHGQHTDEDMLFTDYRPVTVPALLEHDVEEQLDISGDWCRIPAMFRNQAVFIPENFAPGYAYPLIVTLTEKEQGGGAHSQISKQNYVGLRINLKELGLRDASRSIISETVHELISDLANVINISQSRVYLLGTGKFASLALTLALENSLSYCGVLLINPEGELLSNHLMSKTYRGLTVGLIDERSYSSSDNHELAAQLGSLSLKQLAVYYYDDLMVHHNEYEVFNRLLQSTMTGVIW